MATAVLLVVLVTANAPELTGLKMLGGSSCALPVSRQGDWYESDVGRVTITATNISTKGTCVDTDHNFYLLENRDTGCYQCLVIEQRHDNVLQYKQSFCVGRNTLESICTTIHGQTIFRTLIRDASGTATSTACPFHDAYHFIYSNNSGGFCRNPVSYVRPCSPESRLVFHFRRCTDAAYTYDRDWNFECVGTWRQGAHTYLVSRLLTSLTASSLSTPLTDYFRCFIYRVLGTVVHLAMSADSSCRGLRSARNGPVVMELTQDTFGWPKARCTFPAFVTRSSWRDLAGWRVYRANDMGDSVVITFTSSATSVTTAPPHRRRQPRWPRQRQQQQQPPSEPHWQPATVILCHSILEANATSDFFVAETFVLDGCSSKYQCIKFIKKTDSVLEIIEGRQTEFARGQLCPPMHTVSTGRRILITEAVSARACPMNGGQFPVRVGASTSGCVTYLRSGCHDSSVLDVVDTCSLRPGLQLECLRKWREGRHRYVIARRLGDTDGPVSCFSFRRRADSMLFSLDGACNAGLPSYLGDQLVSFVLSQKALKCDWSPPFDAVGGGRSFVDGGGVVDGRAPPPPPPGDAVVPPRDGLASAAGENIKRSRDYRTSSRSNVTTGGSAAAGAASTVLPRLSTTGRTSWTWPLIASPCTCLALFVVVSYK